MDENRRKKFIKALKPNFYEWDAVMNEQTTLEQWKNFLPSETFVLSCKQTIATSRGIVDLLRYKIPTWEFIEYEQGGHMARANTPNVLNGIIDNIIRW